MPGIASTGTVSYGGWAFPAAFNAKVSSTPVYDRARRTVKYRSYTVTIDVILTSGDFNDSPSAIGNRTDSSVETLRVLLQTPGLEFIFNGQGLGDNLTVNYKNCLGFGPRPETLQWEPVGSARAFRLVWAVTFELPECCTSTSSCGIITAKQGIPVSEYCWGVSFGISESGLSTRTIDGTMEIAVFRMSDYRHINTSADWYRRLIDFPTLEGFKRIQNFRLSEDNRTLLFTIVDTEIPSDNPYWPGCIRMDVKFRVRQPGFLLMNRWYFSISGSIEVRPGYEPKIAWLAFHNVVKARVEPLLWFVKTRKSNEDGKGISSNYNKKGYIAFKGLNIEEDIYGKSLNFDLSYWTTIKLENVLKENGLFQNVDTPGGWEAWSKSMQHGVRGRANLGHNPSDSLIVDICHVPTPVFPGADKKVPPKKEPSMVPIYTPPPVEKDNCWRYYDNHIDIYDEYGHITIKHLRKTPSYSTTLNNNGRFDVDPAGSHDGKNDKPNPNRYDKQDITHLRTPDSTYIALFGVGVKIRYPVKSKEVPFLKTICGEPADQYRRGMSEVRYSGPAGSLDGHPMYTVKWKIIYAIPKGKDKITFVLGNENPLLKAEEEEESELK